MSEGEERFRVEGGGPQQGVTHKGRVGGRAGIVLGAVGEGVEAGVGDGGECLVLGSRSLVVAGCGREGTEGGGTRSRGAGREGDAHVVAVLRDAAPDRGD